MCVLSIKVPIRKKSGNLSYAPRIYIEKAFSDVTKNFPWKTFHGKVFNCTGCLTSYALRSLFLIIYKGIGKSFLTIAKS